MIAVASDNGCVDQQVSPASEGLDLEQLLLENRILNFEKYLYQRPINGLLELFKDIEYDASPGTIGGGLKK